jgi:hypothetical protein
MLCSFLLSLFIPQLCVQLIEFGELDPQLCVQLIEFGELESQNNPTVFLSPCLLKPIGF